MVIPKRNDKNHAVSEASAHRSKTTPIAEAIRVSKCCLLLSAVVGGNRVVAGVDARDIDFAIGDDIPILDINTTNFAKGTRSTSGVGDELSNDGKLLSRVDGHAWPIKVGDTHAV